MQNSNKQKVLRIAQNIDQTRLYGWKIHVLVKHPGEVKRCMPPKFKKLKDLKRTI